MGQVWGKLANFADPDDEQNNKDSVKIPRVAKTALGSALFFRLVALASDAYFSKFYWYQMFEAKRKHRYNLYVTSVLHAAIVSGICALKAFRLIAGRTDHRSSPVETSDTIAIALGYFAGDALSTMSEWAQYPADFIHHVSGILMCVAALRAPSVFRYLPFLGGIEFSTIFLGSMWMLREAGLGSTALHHVLTALFIASFAALRVLLMPRVLLAMYRALPGVRASTTFAVAMPALQSLQWFWFTKILLMLRRRVATA